MPAMPAILTVDSALALALKTTGKSGREAIEEVMGKLLPLYAKTQGLDAAVMVVVAMVGGDDQKATAVQGGEFIRHMMNDDQGLELIVSHVDTPGVEKFVVRSDVICLTRD